MYPESGLEYATRPNMDALDRAGDGATSEHQITDQTRAGAPPLGDVVPAPQTHIQFRRQRAGRGRVSIFRGCEWHVP